MSRTFTIKELNDKIDKLIEEVDENQPFAYRHGYLNSLHELKLELNSPEPIVNVTEKIQESLNIIETNKIINSRGANRFKADDE